LFLVPTDEKDAIGKAVSLKPEDLFERLVVQKKGCFCYGQASFLRDMLRALGFRFDLPFSLPVKIHLGLNWS
jgi:arylamine N-acetyltransferase